MSVFHSDNDRKPFAIVRFGIAEKIFEAKYLEFSLSFFFFLFFSNEYETIFNVSKC